MLGDIDMTDKHKAVINRRKAIIILYDVIKGIFFGIIRIINRSGGRYWLEFSYGSEFAH
ncbi:hypothetical protein P3TCK_15809 [Photobacterium profundum 3TCK]|uniref:Uncharacterized protein n=1 Tax=Photobacterium profundum 3TCK TaxID=314280 RepID=Q1Z5U6_9GAMM|nr:hypothetical protein P3TCK_15809 [Photobacterium profundum 3TCK]